MVKICFRNSPLILIKELTIFYTSISFFNFASSLIQIFIPLYLFEKGFSVSMVLLFFALSQVGRLLILPASAYLSSSFGAKKIISIAFIFQIIYFFILQNIDRLLISFLISAFIFGAIQAFFCLPYLVHLSKISPNNSRGRIFSRINIYFSLASAFGPLLGGAIITNYSFTWVFAVAIILTIPAIALLLSTAEVSKIRKINFGLVSIRKVCRDLIANGTFNFQDHLNRIVWPIFIFIIIPQYNKIGFIQTVSLFISIIAFYLAGAWTDRFNRIKLLFAGSVLTSAIGALRVFANSFATAFLFNIATIFNLSLQGVPWNAKLQEHMDEEARIEYTTLFEIGGTAITFAGLLIFIILTQSMRPIDILVYGIIISSLAGLGVNAVRK